MLFRRRNRPTRIERLRVAVWPRNSWARSTRYFGKRVLRLTATPHAIALGFGVVATHGTAEVLEKEGLDVTPVNKVQEGRPHIVDMMKNGDIKLVFNTTESKQAVVDSFSIRRTALTDDIPYYTTVAGARATLRAIDNLKRGALAVRPVQEYLGDKY